MTLVCILRILRILRSIAPLFQPCTTHLTPLHRCLSTYKTILRACSSVHPTHNTTHCKSLGHACCKCEDVDETCNARTHARTESVEQQQQQHHHRTKRIAAINNRNRREWEKEKLLQTVCGRTGNSVSYRKSCLRNFAQQHRQHCRTFNVRRGEP